MIKLSLKVNGTEIEYEGKQKHLKTSLPRILELASRSHNGEIKMSLLELNESLQINLAKLEGFAATIAESSEELENRLKENQEQFQQSLEEIESLAHNLEELIVATRKIQEMQQGFSMQYLMTQQKIHQETREFNLLSNVIKTKHEAVKNAIINIR